MKNTSIFLILLCAIITISCEIYSSSSEKVYKINFSRSVSQLGCDLIFPNLNANSELIELRKTYKLDSLLTDINNDIDRALFLMNWTHNRWKHNGKNQPKKKNVLYILKQAEKGKKFRCVEYGIVLSATLNSFKIPTRTLGLKTKDVETTKSGAGHVVSESYIPDLKKWVFMDPQFNYIPFLNGIPLNAVEYQKAIIENKEAVELRNYQGILKKRKSQKNINWIGKYLYYFDVSFNASKNHTNCRNKSKLMLVPLGAKEPTVFQLKSKMNNYVYTNNLNDFYKKPKYAK